MINCRAHFRRVTIFYELVASRHEQYTNNFNTYNQQHCKKKCYKYNDGKSVHLIKFYITLVVEIRVACVLIALFMIEPSCNLVKDKVVMILLIKTANFCVFRQRNNSPT